MIGYVRELLLDLVVTPQATVEEEERRAFLDVAGRPIDVVPQNLALLASGTVPIAFEIGEGMEVRHTIDVGLDVQHGDGNEADRIRDLIVLDLCKRANARAVEFMAADPDPETGQSVTLVRWEVDYRPLVAYENTPNATARITFSIDCDVRG